MLFIIYVKLSENPQKTATFWKFAGEFSKSCFFLKDFKEFYGVDKEYVVCGTIFFGLHMIMLNHPWSYFMEKSWIRFWKLPSGFSWRQNRTCTSPLLSFLELNLLSNLRKLMFLKWISVKNWAVVFFKTQRKINSKYESALKTPLKWKDFVLTKTRNPVETPRLHVEMFQLTFFESMSNEEIFIKCLEFLFQCFFQISHFSGGLKTRK